MSKENILQKELDLALEKFKQAKYVEAFEDFKLLSKSFNHFLVYWYLGHTAYRLNEYKLAIRYILKSIDLKSKDAINLNFLGELYRQINKNEEAIDAFNEALIIEPNNKSAIVNIASLYSDLGNFDKSLTYLKNLLLIEPLNYYAIYEIAKLDKTCLTNELKEKTQELINDNKLNNENLIYANLILAEFENKSSKFELEINALIKAHSIFLSLKKKAAEEEYNYFNNLLPKFVAKIKDMEFVSNIQTTPIFIMGLPRSGTTLVENIINLGSESIISGEETGVMGKVFFRNQIIKEYSSQDLLTDFKFQSKDLNFIKGKIVDQYNEIGINVFEDRFTDKSLESLLYIDLLHKIFPNAKFIYCSRDRSANIIGVLKVFLPNLLWTHSIEKILNIFKIYQNKLEEILLEKKIQIKVIELEKLSNNPEPVTKELFNFLELNWSDKCLQIAENKNKIIKTVSNKQVRDSIKKHDLSYLANYDFFLKKYNL